MEIIDRYVDIFVTTIFEPIDEIAAMNEYFSHDTIIFFLSNSTFGENRNSQFLEMIISILRPFLFLFFRWFLFLFSRIFKNYSSRIHKLFMPAYIYIWSLELK